VLCNETKMNIIRCH